jgi:hypothetical protein
VVTKRTCAYQHPDGRQCRAAPLRDGLYCLFHDPDHADAVAEARKVAGQRRRREVTVATLYDLPDVTSDEGTRRLMQIGVTDLLGLENFLNRVRVILYAVQTAIKVRESGELAERVKALEAVLKREGEVAEVFDQTTEREDGANE